MGRTLHYEVINRQEITRDERETIKRVSTYCLKGPWSRCWTCEAFELDHGSLKGFCKVLDDDLNAAYVYRALLTITEKTKALVSLYDEGEYIVVPVLIQGGMAKPWIRSAAEAWAYWEERGLLRHDTGGTRTRMCRQLHLLERFAGDFFDPANFCSDDPELRTVPRIEI